MSPDIGEYERASTTVANAYVRPIIGRYLDNLAARLRADGIAAKPMIMTSDGGTIPRSTAVEFPVRLIESGPAGGAMAAAYLGALSDRRDLIAFDMGGTTAKICVIKDGEPSRAGQFEVGHTNRFVRGSGLPIRTPMLEMIEIRAGGGSIATIDELGLLRVGPESAGARPGPARYGLGGSAATVTDADLCLGYLDAGFFLGGHMRLDRERAERAILENVARPLGMPAEVVSWRVVVGGPRPEHRPQTLAAGRGADDALKGRRRVYCAESGGFVDCPVYDRYALGAGAVISGPAIVEEAESTVVIDSGAEMRDDDHDNLHLTLPAAP